MPESGREKVYDAERFEPETICLTVSGLFTSDESISFPDIELSAYDIAVFDTVCTMFTGGCLIFSVEMLVRAMIGNPGLKVTEQKINATTESLKRLINTYVRIRCREEGMEENTRTKAQLLPLIPVPVRSANHKKITTGFRITEEPALYGYAKATGQVYAVPAELFSALNGKSATDETMLLRREIFKAVEGEKDRTKGLAPAKIRYYPDGNDDNGLFSQVINDAGKYASEQCLVNKYSDTHKNVIAILDALVCARYISGYKVIRRGKNIGVNVLIANRIGTVEVTDVAYVYNGRHNFFCNCTRCGTKDIWTPEEIQMHQCFT